MALETVNATNRQRFRSLSNDPEVTFYGKTAQFRLNGAAVAKLTEMNGGREPSRAIVAFDSDTGRIGFSPAEDDNRNAVKLNRDSTNALTRYFGFNSLARAAGLEMDSRFTLPLTQGTGNEANYLLMAVADRQPVTIKLGSNAGRPRKAKTTTGEEVPTTAAA